jgi:hypothetical protein
MPTRCPFLLFGLLLCLAPGPSRGADRALLVVTPEDAWIGAIQPLITLREAQGWRVSVAVLPEPDAHGVASLVAGRRDADPGLSHILLLGSDRSLPMTRRHNPAVQVLDTDDHLLGDDVYGLRGPDGVPVLAVGRFPVDGLVALGRMAEKTVRYERERGAMSPELLLIVGRTPASRRKALGLISAQGLADQAARTLLESLLKRLKAVAVRARTAFDGPGVFSQEEAPAVFAEELGKRPFLWGYAGHGGHDGFATFHSLWVPDSVRAADIVEMKLSTVSGPLISAGCHMALPVFDTLPIATALLLAEGGPPAMAGFTGVNEDYWVAQWFEGLLARIDALDGPTTLGELILQSKRDMVAAPRSDLGVFVEQFMRAAGQLRYHITDGDYPDIVRRNNEMLVILGDPCLTVEVPRLPAVARDDDGGE